MVFEVFVGFHKNKLIANVSAMFQSCARAKETFVYTCQHELSPDLQDIQSYKGILQLAKLYGAISVEDK